jgi:hypothetical protein
MIFHPNFATLTLVYFHSFINYRYDLTIACRDIGLGKIHVPELLGKVHIDPITAENAYETKLDSGRVKNERLLGLLQRYTNRHSFSEREVQEQKQQQTKTLSNVHVNGHLQEEAETITV